MSTENLTTTPVQEQSAAYQQSEAEQKLKSALDGLAKSTTQQLGTLVEGVEGEVKEAIENVTQTMVHGVRDLKAELNVANSIRRQPWNWVMGAAAAGAAAALFIPRKASASKRVAPRESKAATAPSDHISLQTKVNWAIFAAEVGMSLMQARAAKRTERNSPLS